MSTKIKLNFMKVPSSKINKRYPFQKNNSEEKKIANCFQYISKKNKKEKQVLKKFYDNLYKQRIGGLKKISKDEKGRGACYSAVVYFCLFKGDPQNYKYKNNLTKVAKLHYKYSNYIEESNKKCSKTVCKQGFIHGENIKQKLIKTLKKNAELKKYLSSKNGDVKFMLEMEGAPKNHAIGIAKYKGKYFIYDPVMDSILVSTKNFSKFSAFLKYCQSKYYKKGPNKMNLYKFNKDS
ncbi:hypothetical protein ACFL2K_02695 [Candidatus Margulisiibacteriota bacterium]